MPLLAFGMILCQSILSTSASAATDPASVVFADRQVTTSTDTYNYEVYIPAHWDKRKKWPVILFLHGSGERGTDNRAQTKNGIRLLIAQSGDKFPCVVVCPQCRPNVWYSAPAMDEMVRKEMDQAVQEFNGDPKRLYLTGLSMGGYGTWQFAQEEPHKWAAIAPCCGGIVYGSHNQTVVGTDVTAGDPYVLAAHTVVGMPTWVFHGGADPTVPVSEARQMVALLFMLGGDIKYTEYPGVGHNSWDYAYKEPGLLPWMLSHKLK